MDRNLPLDVYINQVGLTFERIELLDWILKGLRSLREKPNIRLLDQKLVIFLLIWPNEQAFLWPIIGPEDAVPEVSRTLPRLSNPTLVFTIRTAGRMLPLAKITKQARDSSYLSFLNLPAFHGDEGQHTDRGTAPPGPIQCCRRYLSDTYQITKKEIWWLAVPKARSTLVTCFMRCARA